MRHLECYLQVTQMCKGLSRTRYIYIGPAHSLSHFPALLAVIPCPFTKKTQPLTICLKAVSLVFSLNKGHFSYTRSELTRTHFVPRGNGPKAKQCWLEGQKEELPVNGTWRVFRVQEAPGKKTRTLLLCRGQSHEGLSSPETLPQI